MRNNRNKIQYKSPRLRRNDEFRRSNCRDPLLASHLVYPRTHIYTCVYVCVEFVYILCRRESLHVHESRAYVCTKDSRPAKEQDFYRRPRIHFRGKTKFRWVVGIGRVLSYFIIHEGTFLPAVAPPPTP